MMNYSICINVRQTGDQEWTVTTNANRIDEDGFDMYNVLDDEPKKFNSDPDVQRYAARIVGDVLGR